MVQTRVHTEGAVFAVHVGRQRGIYATWSETLRHVKGYPDAIYKKLGSRAEAQKWLDDYAARDLQRATRTSDVSDHDPDQQLSVLALDFETAASREIVAEEIAEATAAAENMSIDPAESDEEIDAAIREAEEKIRRLRARKSTQNKTNVGAAVVNERQAATQPKAGASTKKEEGMRVKEESVEVDVETWSRVKPERKAERGERRYTSSEKGKWRDGTSQRPAANTSLTVLDDSKPAQNIANPASSAPLASDTKPAPTRSTPSAAPSSGQRTAVPSHPPPTSSQRPVITMKSISNSTKPPTSTGVAAAPPVAANQAEPALPDSIIIAYTDGAAPDNQFKDLRVAGYGIHWAAGRPADVPEDISRRCARGRTNNYAELLAIIRTLELTASDPRPLTILSDSDYSIKCFEWFDGWRRRGWKTSKNADVKNLDMIRYMVALRTMRAGPTTLRHVRGHTKPKSGVKETADQLGNRLADKLAVAGANLPEAEAETETDDDWAQQRASAEKRVEERQKKLEAGTIHIDVGSALGLTQDPTPDVGPSAQGVGRVTLAQKQQDDSAAKAAGSAPPKKSKLSRDAIMAALHAPIPDEPAPSSNVPIDKKPLPSSAQTRSQSPAANPQSIDPSTPARAPAAAASSSASSTVTRMVPPALAPHTPTRSRANEHASAPAVHAHTTPVATAPAKQDGKVVVRILDDDEHDEGIWDEEDTLDDADMIAEALGR